MIERISRPALDLAHRDLPVTSNSKVDNSSDRAAHSLWRYPPGADLVPERGQVVRESEIPVGAGARGPRGIRGGPAWRGVRGGGRRALPPREAGGAPLSGPLLRDTLSPPP